MERKLTENQIDTWAKMLVIQSRSIISIDADLAQNEEISMVWYDILLILSKEKDKKLRLSQIADKSVLTRSGLSRCIANLESQGYIKREKCEVDKRSSFAVLTKKGQKAQKQAWPIYRKGIIENFLKHLDDKDISDLSRIFDKILGSEGLP